LLGLLEEGVLDLGEEEEEEEELLRVLV